jgi:uncharacterized membrane protein (UPF0127 family)
VGRPSPTLTLRREDGRVIADSVTVADTTPRRLRGLLGRSELPPGEGMLLRPAWSIHTMFMRFPIDVVFLDPEQIVIKIEPALPPFRTASCRGAREVVELSAGECARRGLTLGDRVAWAARAAWDEGTSSESVLAGGERRPSEAEASIAVVSGDPRFAKLARFLLDGRHLHAITVAPDHADVELGSRRASVVVLDVGTDVADGLRRANALRVESPSSTIVLAREGGEGTVPGGFDSFHKWDETELLIDEVERLATAGHPSTEG